MTTVARYCFANLAISAKMHRSLNAVGANAALSHAEAVRSFEMNVGRALPALQTERRKDALRQLSSDVADLEQMYHACRDRLPGEAVQRYDRLLLAIRKKISEKEVSIGLLP